MVIVCSIFYSYVYQRVFFEVLEQSKIANTHWTEDTEALACAAWFAASHNPQVGHHLTRCACWRTTTSSSLKDDRRIKKTAQQAQFHQFISVPCDKFWMVFHGKKRPQFLEIETCCRFLHPLPPLWTFHDVLGMQRPGGQVIWTSDLTLWFYPLVI